MNRTAQRLIPIALRLSSLTVRTILVFVLARYLTASDMGLYGLLLAAISYGVYVVGLDFYTFANRDVLRTERDGWARMFRSQAALYASLHVCVLAGIGVAASAGGISWTVAAFLMVLLPFEHLGQELDRALVAIGEQATASVCMFVRQAVAPLVAVPVMAAEPAARSLDWFVCVWLALDVIAVLLGARLLLRRVPGPFLGPIDRAWIRRGIATSLILLAGTVCLRALFTLDRQFLAAFTSLEVVGAYTVFIAVGNGMSSVVAVGVHQFMYPDLIRAAKVENWLAFRRTVRRLWLQTVVVVVGVSAVALLSMPLLLRFIDRQVYWEHQWILPWILVAMGIFNLSLVPQLCLLALDRDRTILISTVVSFGAFGASLVLSAASGRPLIGVLFGISVAAVVLLVWKSVVAIQLVRQLPGRASS